jgi:hypothetical protein
MIRIGIDTGGTFTDIVSVDGANGGIEVTKVASTPHNPAIGLALGVNQILAQAAATHDKVAAFAHGTQESITTYSYRQVADRGPMDESGGRRVSFECGHPPRIVRPPAPHRRSTDGHPQPIRHFSRDMLHIKPLT